MHQVPAVLPQVLLLVFGEVHQVPQQERLHHGAWTLAVMSLRTSVEVNCNVCFGPVGGDPW